MKLIPAATLYKCELPKANDLDQLLSGAQFQELEGFTFSRIGFEVLTNSFFTQKFQGGYAFKVRYDEKIIPKAAVNAEAEKRIHAMETDYGRKIGRKERSIIKEEVFNDFLPRALFKTLRLTCFYRPADKLLILPTTSNKLADTVMSKLLKTIGSIKAETLYIDGIKQSLTAKLKDNLDSAQDHVFQPFSMGGQAKLKSEYGDTYTFKIDSLGDAIEGIQEALRQEAKVEELSFRTANIYFRLDKDFKLKGIQFLGEPEQEEFETPEEEFEHEAATQVLLVSDVCNQLLKLFEYKEPEDDSVI